MQSREHHGLLGALFQAMRHPVSPRSRGYLAFGWLILMLFFIQVLTGILLSLYYQPSPEMAYESVKFILRDVTSGWLVRGAHHWAAQGMVALGLLQLLRIFVSGAYKGQNRTLWTIGILLLLLTFGFCLTGNLLPWDQRAYWSALFALEGVEAIPLAGPALGHVLRGGDEVGAATLSRFYSIHALILPWLMFYLVLVHLWLMARRSGSGAGEA
jgi:quinol-cytochrome oxidoreductase complex cytochrome b subunit